MSKDVEPNQVLSDIMQAITDGLQLSLNKPKKISREVIAPDSGTLTITDASGNITETEVRIGSTP